MNQLLYLLIKHFRQFMVLLVALREVAAERAERRGRWGGPRGAALDGHGRVEIAEK